jgi:hypothetical protein
VGVGSGYHIGPSKMYLRVNCERRTVHVVPAFDYIAFVVNQNQVRHPDLAEVHAERIDPEMISEFGVSRSYVTRDSFIKPEARKQTEGRSEALLPI